MKKQIRFEDFGKVDIRTGTILKAELNPGARNPAYVLRIDFGELGVKTSSAQITENYKSGELEGKQVVAVVNLPPKRIAGVSSEVLVLGAIPADGGVVLLGPDQSVGNGVRIG